MIKRIQKLLGRGAISQLNSLNLTSLKAGVITVFLFFMGLSANFAQGVSLGFSSGYLGTQGTNTNKANNIKKLSTLGIARVSFSQSYAGTFGGTQGNDLSGTLKLYLNSGSVISLTGALNWRETTGSRVEVFGFIFDPGQNATISYGSGQTFNIVGGSTPNSSSTLGLKAYASTFTFVDGENRDGNAATSGLLAALNAELANTPQPSTITLTNTNVTEGQNLVYTVALSSATTAGNPQVYTFTKAGTSSATADYNTTFTFSNGVVNNGDGTITVPGGVSSFTVTVTTIDDNLVEPTETLILNIGSKSATGNILDNDGTITTTGTLSAFTACAGSVSTAQSFTFSGVGLSSSVQITAPTGFELSTSQSGTYTSTLTYSVSGGAITTTTVWVRTKSTAVSSSGNISLAATGAVTKTIAASATINVRPSISINVIPDVTTTATSFSIPYTGLSAGADLYSLTAGTISLTGFVAVSNASITTTQLTIPIPASAQNSYDFNLTIKNNTTGCTSTQALVLTVSDINPGILSADQSICSGTIPGTFTGTAASDVSANAPSYIWQVSTTGIGGPYVDIAGATSDSYAPTSPLTATTYYRRKATIGVAVGTTHPIEVIVNPIPVVSISPASSTFNAGSNVTLTASGANSYSWSPSTGLSATNTASVVATVTSTTTYTVIGTTISLCSSSASVTITVSGDSDGDGVTDSQEASDNTDPNDGCDYLVASRTLTPTAAWNALDCDGDGTPNGTDTDPKDPCVHAAGATPVTTNAIWRAADCDGDGVTNGKETDDNTDPNDGCDYLVASISLTPSAAWNALDCDGDGTPNGTDTDPKDPCVHAAGATPVTTNAIWRAADCDGDGVTNGKEKDDNTDPNDGCSYLAASKTLTPSSAWNALDCDGDGTPNGTDTDPKDPCVHAAGATPVYTNAIWRAADCDGDGVTNGKEKDDNTDPNDGCSYLAASKTLTPSTAWNALDCDGDGTPNGTDTDPKDPCVHAAGATPVYTNAIWRAADCDGDGVTNGKETDDNTDPNDGCSYLAASKTLTPSAAWNALDCDGDGTPNGTDTDPKDPCVHAAGATPVITNAIWRAADCDGDGVTNGKEKDDNTDPNDGCSYLAASKTLTPSTAWNALDCDGDGTPNGTDTDPKDPCVHAAGATPVTTNAIWRAADCDGDGVTNGKETDDNTDPNNGCSFVAASKTLTPTSNWGALDCDGDGNPNATDPNKDTPVASNDAVTVGNSGKATINLLSNDDFLPGANTEIVRQAPPNDGTAKGTVTFNPLTGEMTYKRAPFESGLVTLGYKVTNKAVTPPVSATAFVTIIACDLQDPLADCDGDGDPNGTDTAPNDPCVYSTTLQVKANVSDDWKALDCDGDGVINGTELTDGTSPADGCSFKAPSITLAPSAAWLLLDCDADGITNKVEGTQDFDGDGIPNCLDTDSDGDSISDKLETTVDTDKDGKPDYLDLDSDNDGILDSVENRVCTGTGILCDTDADGIPNFRDLDSDADQIKDVIEANGSDYNKDGIADGNIDEKGIPTSANKGLTPPDTDRDGKLDPYDVDSDGDGILDYDEEYNEDADFPDCDHDGIINRLDPDECDIFSPQGISPNGDGKNDRLVFKGLFLRKIPNRLSIYNRWGTLVFEMESYDNTFTGTSLPDGTYYYILDFFGKKPTISNYLSVDRTIK